MEQIISKEELEELMKIKGETMGNSIKNTGKFILREEGEEGLERLEKTLRNIGHPVKFEEIKATGYYPSNLLAIIFVVIKRLFNYDDKKFREMGIFRVKLSLMIKLLMRYLVSLEKTAEKAPYMWRKFFTEGDCRIVEINKEKGYAVVRVENYVFHPIQCQIILGIFSTLLSLIIKKKAECEETKCIHKGDEYHEFLVKW